MTLVGCSWLLLYMPSEKTESYTFYACLGGQFLIVASCYFLCVEIKEIWECTIIDY